MDAAAATAIAAAGAAAWSSATAYSTYQLAISPGNYQTYRRTSTSPGASSIDPKDDPTRWVALTGPGFVSRTSTAGNTLGLNGINEFVTCVYGPGDAFYTLPDAPTDGQRVRVLFSNASPTNKIYVSGGTQLKVNTQTINSGGYLLLNDATFLIREFVYVAVLGVWVIA